MKIETVIADAEREVNSLKRSIRRDRDDVEEIIDFAKRQGRQNLTEPEDRQAEEIFSRIQRNRDALDRVEAKLGRAQAVKTETDEQEKRLEGSYSAWSYDGATAGGSHGPVTNSLRSASSL